MGREADGVLPWSWLLARLGMPDALDCASGVLLIDGLLSWAFCCNPEPAVFLLKTGAGPTSSWVAGDSIIVVLNWLFGNMLMPFDIMSSESSMSIDMDMPLGYGLMFMSSGVFACMGEAYAEPGAAMVVKGEFWFWNCVLMARLVRG